ncbi:hypothetical protein [Kitasatospora sp. McL0602]|uniref:hypothetical protein n=1 Tax=Kitasatospora sp. McL0602 TaxID=3439530 RepID=UPI003F8B854E
MTDELPLAPTSAIERRNQLLLAMRQGGGSWDWHRARETYYEQPDPRTVRRDLEQLRKAGTIQRDRETGLYTTA